MERLAREKIATQQRLAELKNELSQWMDILEIDRIIRQTVQPEDDQASTSTASGTHKISLLLIIPAHCRLSCAVVGGSPFSTIKVSLHSAKVKCFQVFCNDCCWSDANCCLCKAD